MGFEIEVGDERIDTIPVFSELAASFHIQKI